MKKSSIETLAIIGVVVIVIAVFGSMFVNNTDFFSRKPAHPKHEIIKTRGMKVVWEIEHVFKYYLQESPFISTANGKIFFLGNAKQARSIRGNVIDSQTGSLIAQTEPVLLDADFATDGTFFYIGEFDYVYKYDFMKGQRVWTQHITNTKAPCCFQIVNNELQTNWYEERFVRLSIEDGQIIDEVDTFGGIIYRQENGFTYNSGGKAAFSVQKGGKSYWQVKVDRGHPPVFTEKVIYIRSGKLNMGSVYAIDRRTGKALWKTEENVISNVAAYKDRAYFLTEDGHLFGVSSRGAKIMTEVVFSPDDFYHFSPSDANAYEVAYDETTGYVIVLLGDSEQLIALKETW